MKLSNFTIVLIIIILFAGGAFLQVAAIYRLAHLVEVQDCPVPVLTPEEYKEWKNGR